MKLYLVTVARIVWRNYKTLTDDVETLAAVSFEHALWLQTRLAAEVAEEEEACRGDVTIREVDIAADPVGFTAWLDAFQRGNATLWDEAVDEGIVARCECPVLAGKLVAHQTFRGQAPRRLTREEWERERIELQPLPADSVGS